MGGGTGYSCGQVTVPPRPCFGGRTLRQLSGFRVESPIDGLLRAMRADVRTLSPANGPSITRRRIPARPHRIGPSGFRTTRAHRPKAARRSIDPGLKDARPRGGTNPVPIPTLEDGRRTLARLRSPSRGSMSRNEPVPTGGSPDEPGTIPRRLPGAARESTPPRIGKANNGATAARGSSHPPCSSARPPRAHAYLGLCRDTWTGTRPRPGYPSPAARARTISIRPLAGAMHPEGTLLRPRRPRPQR